MAPLSAADELESIPLKLLVCLGFGVEVSHGDSSHFGFYSRSKVNRLVA